MKPCECVLDIETYPEIPDGMINILKAELKAPSNLKDPEKIAAALARKEAALVEKAALSPLTARVVIVGMGFRQKGGEWEYQVLTDENELTLLGLVDLAVAGRQVTKRITYNGARFDIPFLVARCMKHGFVPKWKWPVGRYHPMHVDMYDVLGEGSLEKWMVLLTGQRKKSSGSQIAELIDSGRLDEAVEHCLDDIKALAMIYERYRRVADNRRR